MTNIGNWCQKKNGCKYLNLNMLLKHTQHFEKRSNGVQESKQWVDKWNVTNMQMHQVVQ